MKVSKGIYDIGREVNILEEEDYDITFDKRVDTNGWECFLIPFEDIDLYGHDEINFSKYYYHPNTDVYYNTFKSDDYLKAFGLRVFFSPIYQVSNSISFKQNNEWASLTTNAEYVLQPIIDGHHKHVRIFLKKGSDLFYRWRAGKVEYKKINKVHLPKPNVISFPLLDYYLFKGYDFYDDNRFFDIRKSKEDIRKAGKELRYYFVGTSIYDEARDVDIYVHKGDFNEMCDRLEDDGFKKIDWSPSYQGSMFEDKYTKAKIDVITSPYSDYEEPIDENNNAEPLLMYFIQVNYYASIRYDNLTEFFKMWRFNKLLETAKKLGLQDGGNSYQEYFVDSYMSEERFQKYYDIFSHPNAVEQLYRPDNPTIWFNSVKIADDYYIAVKSKHKQQLVNLHIPYKIKNFEVIDEGNIGRAVVSDIEGGTNIQLRFLENYALLKYNKDE